MSYTEIKINKVKINHLVVFPILQFIFKPEMLKPNFYFFGDHGLYLHCYKRTFIARARKFEAKKTNKRILPFRYPSIETLGNMTPLAGNELKNNPLYRSKGGRISAVVLSNGQSWLLPLKVKPKWEYKFEHPVLDKYNLTFECSPLLKIYPFGMISCQIKNTITSKDGIDIENFILLLKYIMEKELIKCHFDNLFVGKFSIKTLTKKMYKTILENLIANNNYEVDINYRPHYIITFYDTDGKLIPNRNKKELAALVKLESTRNTWTDNFIQKHKGKIFEGEKEDQFFSVHPQCTIIHPAKPANNEDYNDYVIGCLESNITSVIELATLQNQLAKASKDYVRWLLRKQSTKENAQSLNMLKEIGDTNLFKEYKILGGVHQQIYKYFINKIGFKEHRNRRNFNTLQKRN